MIVVTRETLDPAALLRSLGQEGAGSVVVHIGKVKPDPAAGRSAGITFAERGDLAAEMEAVAAEVSRRHGLIDLLFARRLGRLLVGDVILFIGVAAKDRESAFAACREALERAKTLKTLAKQEHLVEGS